MKSLSRVLVAGLLIIVTALPAFSWEFTITGDYELRYRYFSRTGQDDLFGNVNMAQSANSLGLTTIGFSAPQRNQVVPEGLSSKGSDGSYTEQRLILYPSIKFNPALSLKSEWALQGNLNGLYQGGSNWADSYNGWNRLYTRAEDGDSAMATGAFRALWFEANIPWGKITIGRFPFGFGPGWSGLHVNDYKPTLVMLSVPYGPLKISVAQGLGSTGAFTDSYDSRNVNRTPHTLSSATDKNQMQAIDFMTSIQYATGPFDMGILWRWIGYKNVHSNPFLNTTLRDDITGSFLARPLSFGSIDGSGAGQTGGTPGQTGSTDLLLPISGDMYFDLFVIYAKYYNGRYFFNAEYDQEYFVTKKQGARTISGYPKAWMIEMGAFAGPAKLSLANFYSSGHVRSGGQLDFTRNVGSNGVTQVSDKWQLYVPLGGRHSAIDPYTFIIGTWGTGNNSYDASGNPTFQDFVGYAARIDYAVAANLNVWTSYLYAQRQSKTSTGWGQYSGGILPSPVRSSNVPDVNLGWELDVGMDWKLLENFNLNLKFGTWKPGDWFKAAYMDLATANTIADPLSSADVHINPNRSIDPIVGAQIGFQINF